MQNSTLITSSTSEPSSVALNISKIASYISNSFIHVTGLLVSVFVRVLVLTAHLG